MDAADKSNLKRIREVLLADEMENDNVSNDTDQNSNSDSDFDPGITESDDTSAYENLSEESHSSCSDNDQDNTFKDSQPETLEKAGVTWSVHPNPVQGRIPAVNIMKKESGPTTKIQTIFDTFRLFFTDEILDHIVLHTNTYAKCYFEGNKLILLN